MAAKPKTESGEIVIPKPEIASIQVGIVGTSPLIVHAWSEKATRMMLNKQMGLPTPKKEPKSPEDDYNGARYISSQGWDGVPATAFKAAMVGACRLVEGLPMTMARRLFFVEADDRELNLVRIFAEPQMRQDMVRLESGVADSAVQGSVGHHWPGGPWFTGYETEPRWMRLKASGAEIQCVEGGLLLRAPAATPHAEAFSGVCEAHAIGPDLLLKIPQAEVGGRQLDTKDRIQLGAALLRDLASAGM